MKLSITLFIAVATLRTGTPAVATETNQVALANTNQPALANVAPNMDALDDRQLLGPGDVVTFRVIEDEDKPRSLTVTDSGDLEVPYYGLVHATGKTSRALAREIKRRLEENLYYHATVIVAIEVTNKKRTTGKVYVTGQVRNAGGYDIPADEQFTVSKAILTAGGFIDFSDKRHVRLVRKTPEGKKTIIINVLDIWEKGALDKDQAVQPDDLIVVPERLVNF